MTAHVSADVYDVYEFHQMNDEVRRFTNIAVSDRERITVMNFRITK